MSGPRNPQALNRYSYVLNNPLTHTDPTGHCVPDVNCPRDECYRNPECGQAPGPPGPGGGHPAPAPPAPAPAPAPPASTPHGHEATPAAVYEHLLQTGSSRHEAACGAWSLCDEPWWLMAYHLEGQGFNPDEARCIAAPGAYACYTAFPAEYPRKDRHKVTLGDIREALTSDCAQGIVAAGGVSIIVIGSVITGAAVVEAAGVTTATVGTTIASTSYLGYQALGGENTPETLEHLSHFSEAAAENVASCVQ